MGSNQHRQTSKFLSYVLRHAPDTIGITLDEAGWTSVAALLRASEEHGRQISIELLREVVATSDKKRFSLNEDGTQIRANQGHSVEIDLGLESTQPPDHLYHGTPERFVGAIRKAGLLKMSRHAVHLSVDTATAAKVGSRRGRPVILEIRAGEMHAAGFSFGVSDNGVWLVEHVPAEYIVFPD